MRTGRNTVITILAFLTVFTACVQPVEQQQSHTYTVRYDANGGSGEMADSVFTYGETYTLPKNAFTREGYAFAGWSSYPFTSTANNSPHYYDGGNFIFYLPDYYDPYYSWDLVTLYAVWRDIYTVRFDVLGGSGPVPPAQKVVAGSGIILPGGDGLIRDGFTFAGWYANRNMYQGGYLYTPTANTTLYAEWEAVRIPTYTVSYGSAFTETVEVGSSLTIRGGDGLYKNGFTFIGWNTDVYGAGTGYSAGETFTPTGDITLHPIWAVDTIEAIPLTENIWMDGGFTPTVTEIWYSFEVTGGTTYYLWYVNYDRLTVSVSAVYGNGADIFSQTYVNSSPPANQPVFTAYAGGTVYVRVVVVSYYNVSIRAGDFALAYSAGSVSPAAYLVVFDANYGSGTVPNRQNVQPGAGITLPGGSGLTRTGYTFGGWNTSADGTGTNYSAGSAYTPTNGIILYARWLRNYNVALYSNDGSASSASHIVPGTTSIILPLPVRFGYTFDGWNTDVYGTGASYNAGDTFTPTGDITLHGMWLADPGVAGITLDIEQIIDGAPIIAGITISRTGNGYPVTFTVSVDAADYDTGNNAISWVVAGVGVYASQTVYGYNASFTLDAGNFRYNSLGGHVLRLTVMKGGQQYQRAIPFTIVR